MYVAFCESEGNQTNFAESWPVKGTCQVELLSVGVTVIPGQVGHEMPSSAVGLRCPITASSDAQPACLQKVDDVHVCPCLCQAPVCVSQAVSEEGEEEEEEGGLTVRPSLSLVCPSSAVPFRHVPVAFALNPPPLRHHLLMLLRRVCQSSTGIKPPETPSSLPLALYRLVVTQT